MNMWYKYQLLSGKDSALTAGQTAGLFLCTQGFRKWTLNSFRRYDIYPSATPYNSSKRHFIVNRRTWVSMWFLQPTGACYIMGFKALLWKGRLPWQYAQASSIQCICILFTLLCQMNMLPGSSGRLQPAMCQLCHPCAEIQALHWRVINKIQKESFLSSEHW